MTGWQEGQVQQEFTAGHAAFAINYPFVASVDATTKGSPAMGHTGYIPFPAAPGGTPGSALGGEMLAINAKTANVAAAWKLIQYLTSPSVEIARAEATGDPPSLPSRLHLRALREGAVLQAGQDAQRLRPAAAGEPELPADLGRPADRALVGVRQHHSPARGAESAASPDQVAAAG